MNIRPLLFFRHWKCLLLLQLILVRTWVVCRIHCVPCGIMCWKPYLLKTHFLFVPLGNSYFNNQFIFYFIIILIFAQNSRGQQPRHELQSTQGHDVAVPGEGHSPSNDYKDGACRIENGQERTFSVNRGNNACVAHFHSVMLRNVRRPDRGKNEELVTEHKYAFVFYTVVSILNETYKLKVIWTLRSLDHHHHHHRLTSLTPNITQQAETFILNFSISHRQPPCFHFWDLSFSHHLAVVYPWELWRHVPSGEETFRVYPGSLMATALADAQGWHFAGKNYFCQESGKKPVITGFCRVFFQNHIEFDIIVAFIVRNHINWQYYSTFVNSIILYWSRPNQLLSPFLIINFDWIRFKHIYYKDIIYILWKSI